MEPSSQLQLISNLHTSKLEFNEVSLFTPDNIRQVAESRFEPRLLESEVMNYNTWAQWAEAHPVQESHSTAAKNGKFTFAYEFTNLDVFCFPVFQV